MTDDTRNDDITMRSASQRAMVAARMSNYPKGTVTRATAASCVTAGRAAEQMGVGVQNVIIAKAVLRAGTPDLIAAIDAGALALHAAYQIIKTVPVHAQAETLARAITARGRSGRLRPYTLTRDPVRRKRSPRRSLARRVEHGLDQLESAVELLNAFLAEPGAKDAAEVVQWVARLATVRASISTLITPRRSPP